MSDILEAFDKILKGEEEKRLKNPYTPPPLLWDEITRHIQPAEQDVVRAKIGEGLLEANSLMHKEASSLAEILHEVQAKNQTARKKLNSYLQLTEKTEHKLLRAQIQSYMTCLVDHLKRKGSEETLKNLVKVKNDDEESALSYTLRGMEVDVPLSGTQLPTPRRPSSARPPTSSGKINEINLRNFDIWTVGRVVYDLREALIEERQALASDLQSLKACLSEEATFHVKIKSGSLKVLPSVNDLKKLGEKVKHALEEQTDVPRKPQTERRPSAPGNVDYSKLPSSSLTRTIRMKSLQRKPSAPILDPIQHKVKKASGESKSSRSRPVPLRVGTPTSITPPPLSPSQSSRQHYKNSLVALLKRHNPKKLKNVDLLLDMYKGKEHDLLQNVRAKYAMKKKSRPLLQPQKTSHRISNDNIPQSQAKEKRSKLRDRISEARSFAEKA